MCHWIGDDRDIYDSIEARRHTQAQYRTPEWRGRRAAPDHFGPLVLEAATWVAPYPKRFRPPMHISKYNSETNLDHWLEDYHIIMKARVSDDDFAIQYHPLLVSSSTRAWLE